MSDKAYDRDPLEKVRDLSGDVSRGLMERIKEIDEDLLVLVTSGNPSDAKDVRLAQPEYSVLTTRAGWEQSSWHKAWRDSSGWTDVWGQSRPQ